jgi:hypothetical protein
LCLALFALSSEALILDCTYSVRGFFNLPNLYTCTARVVFIGDPRHVTEVSTNHLPGRNNNDVLGISIQNQNLKFLPRNISNFFPNTQGFDVNYCGLEKIEKEDISGFKNLSTFYPADNNIRLIPNDMFEDNPLINFIAMGRNPIRHIAANVFDNLPLTELYLNPLSCINAEAVNRSNVKDLIFKVAVSCPPTFEMNFERIQARLQLENNCDQCERRIDEQISERINPLTWKMFEMDQSLQKLEERVFTLEEALKNCNSENSKF